MNYILVSTQIRCETGPTTVGDQHSDPEIMKLVQAKLISRLGNTFTEYVTDWPPRLVLDRLSQEGFKMLTMAGIGQTCVWTMGRESTQNNS
ncbi:GTP cyclohydrolase 1 feedback regulatory protein [Aphelenchoides bicaudatus]|nr:GTP cyclohydrolase 1 feedback regulatory protein [Aphelenchoides bicaudatus]